MALPRDLPPSSWGRPWVAGTDVWVFGAVAGRGRACFKVARLSSRMKLSEDELKMLYQAWVRLNRTLKEDEVDRMLFAKALRG
jgi:hypothetical protein